MSVPQIRANYEPSTPTTLDPCVAFAVSAFPGHWCVSFLVPEHGRLRTDWYEGDPENVRQALLGFTREGRTLVGYDPEGQDTHLLAGILAGQDPYELSVRLAAESRQYHRRPADLPCDAIDLAARLRVGGKAPTLLSVAANLGHPILAEPPFPAGTVLSDELWPRVREYKQVLVWQIWALLVHLLPEIQAIETLAPEVGRDLRSLPKARVVEELFKSHYHRKTGRLPVQPQPPQEVTYQPVAGVRRPRTPEAAAWFDTVTTQPMKVGEQGGVTVPVAKFRIGRIRLSVGGGGLHSQDAPALYISGPKYQIVSIDAISFYPSLIALKGITPRAYGEHGQAIFREILNRRMDLKRRISQAVGEVREQLERQSYALKIVLNATFGKFGSSYSTLYDPESLVKVTISGQLMMLELIERLTAGGIEVLTVNTDGLFLKVDRQDVSWRNILAVWQTDTGMTLEVEPVERLAVFATNDFALKGEDGKHKRRGAILRETLDAEHVPWFLIVNDAVANALLEDIPPEVTVQSCTNPDRFCGVRRLASNVRQAVIRDATQDLPLPRVIRWYHARGVQNRIVQLMGDGRETKLADNVAIGLPVAGFHDVDIKWYIQKAHEQLSKVEIPRSVTTKLIGSQSSELGEVPPKPQSLQEQIESEDRKQKGPVDRVHSLAGDRRRLPRPQLVGLTPLRKFQAQLEAMGISYSPCGDGFTACCPVHRESCASLTFGEADDGTLLLCCHACKAPFEKIMEAVGLRARDAFGNSKSDEIVIGLEPPSPSSRGPQTADQEHLRLTAEAVAYERALPPQQLRELATRLGVAEAALRRLGVGWRPSNRRLEVSGSRTVWVEEGPAWTFPEVDAAGHVIGIQRRFSDPAIGKRMLTGGKRGIYLPRDWLSLSGPIYIPEGASDVAALVSAGRCAMGRPSALGGLEQLVRLLWQTKREIIVVGENDRKPDGRWPGKEGMDYVAAGLAERLGRPVSKQLPPSGSKDVREYLRTAKSSKEASQ